MGCVAVVPVSIVVDNLAGTTVVVVVPVSTVVDVLTGVVFVVVGVPVSTVVDVLTGVVFVVVVAYGESTAVGLSNAMLAVLFYIYLPRRNKCRHEVSSKKNQPLLTRLNM
jgi:hypothetical protein